MTWHEFMEIYDPGISGEAAEFVLWEKTAFPCASLKTVTRQIRRAVRVKNNKIKDCDICGMMQPYHSYGCPAASRA